MHPICMKIDPWKNKGILEGISKFNSDLIIEYLEDMESGFNVTHPGSRSYTRLNNLRQGMR